MTRKNRNNRIIRNILLTGAVVVLAVVVLLLAGSQNTEGTTLTVDDNGNAEYPSIQDAVDAADEGDTVKVWEGTYYENVKVDRSIDVIGNGSETTTINGGGVRGVVLISADWVNLSGFYLTGSYGYGKQGILVRSSHNTIFWNNCSGNEMGIDLFDAHYNNISDNICDWNENYGIFLDESDHNTIVDSNCSNNQENGILIRSSFMNTIDSCDCDSNGDNGIELYFGAGNIVNSSNCSYNYANGIFVRGALYHNPSENIISGNYFTHNGETGIQLLGSEGDSLRNNTCQFNEDYGIWLESSKYTTVIDCNCSFNDDEGIYSRSSHALIQGNELYSNGDHGIAIFSNYNTVDDNHCTFNEDNGINIRNADFTTVTGNLLLSNEDFEIALANAACASLSGNTMDGGGVEVTGEPEHWNTHNIDITNTVNGKNVRYYANGTDINIPSTTGQLILANCSNTTVEGLNCSDVRIGIQVGYSTNISVQDNICMNDYYGISIRYSSYVNITGNQCNGNRHGIYSWYGEYNNICDNNCTSNSQSGIYLYHAENFTVSGNECQDDLYGIRLSQSHYNEICDNLCCNNSQQGIKLQYSENNTLTNNRCSSNREGICLFDSRTNVLKGNIILSNKDSGIEIYYYSDYNHFERNEIRNNGMGIHISYALSGETPVFLSMKNTAHYNNIMGNVEYGIHCFTSDDEPYAIDARNNWWGIASGPYHSTNNTDGKGDNVTDYVEFDPWLKKPYDYFNPQAIIDSITPSQVLKDEEASFIGHGIVYNKIERYVWTSSINGEIYNSTTANFTNSSLSVGEHTIYLKVQDNYGVWSDEVNTTLVILKDSDDDSVPDNSDAFPNDPAASKDSDGDGYPDEWNEGKTEKDSTTGLKLDEYPDNPNKWKKEEDDKSFLFKTIGPLPTYAYFVLVIIGLAAIVGALKMKNGGSSTDQSQQMPQQLQQSKQMLPQQFPQQAQMPQPPAQQAYQPYPPAQMQPASRQTQPPAQSQYQQQAPPQPPRQQFQQPQPTQPAVPSPGPPAQATWLCPKCGNRVEQKFIFCTECGFRRTG